MIINLYLLLQAMSIIVGLESKTDLFLREAQMGRSGIC